MKTASTSASDLDAKLHLTIASSSKVSKYPAKSHARRVAKELGVSEGLIYLVGEISRDLEDSDMPTPFRQKRYFYYLTGFDYPDSHVTYDIETDILSLWMTKPDPKEKLWSGPSPTPKSTLLTLDIDASNYTENLESTITAYTTAHPSSKIHIIHDQYPPISEELYKFCSNKDLKYAVDVCRVIKDDYEVNLIRRANEISSHGHMKIMANIDILRSEREIEGIFVDESIKRGGKLAYDTIACSGKNCSILHYVKNDEKLEGKQLVLLDAGAEYECYASDVTRTFPINGVFGKEAKEIYALVYKMQKEVFGMIKSGVKFRELYLKAMEIAVQGLVELGVLVGETKELIDKGAGRVFFPHGLGHHVGLEVHDVLLSELVSTGIPKLRRRTPVMPIDVFEAYMSHEVHNHLKPGMVFTVEPGIYFNKPLYEDYITSFPDGKKYIGKALENYWDVGGVRIEDCVVVTEDGFENLTPAPKELVEIEELTKKVTL